MARVLVGALVGGLSGAAAGAAGFAVAEKAFGRGLVFLGKWPLLAAVIGIVFVGVPGVAVGAVAGGLGPGRGRGAFAGLAAGVLIVSAVVARTEGRYLYEGGYFDGGRFFSDVIMYSTWLAGLAAAGRAVSSAMGGLFPPSK